MQDLKKDTTKEGPRASQLSKGRERFLAHVIEHGFEVGRRSPEDFVRHFPPTLIMEGLKDQPKLRADILVQATGVKEKVAIKKSWESCADDLQIALDEGETNATAVMKIFQLDDRVRYLDHKALWSYVTEGEFWKISPSRQKEYAAAKSHMAFMLQRALEDKLVSHQDIVEGITVARLLRAAAAAKKPIPVGAALYVAHEVLRGLEYAHDARDEAGRPLRLVHRDVSPGNVLIGAAGLGGIVGMLLLAARKDVRGLMSWIAASGVTAGTTLLVFSYSTSFVLSLAMVAVVGLAALTVAMGVSTIIQTIVEDRMRGRVMGLFTVSFMGMFPLGSLAAGAIAERIGPQHTLAAGGVVCVLTGIWLWRKLPELRTHIRPIYVRLGIINE